MSKLLISSPKFKDTLAAPHFKESEFKCPCCGSLGQRIHPRLLFRLECMRSYFGDCPIVITSGYRCRKYNSSLKGSSKTSGHMKGKAADLYIEGVSTAAIIDWWNSHIPQGYAYTNDTNMKGVVHVQVV
nr:MAG TPA: peptidase [Microviridae sp.]